MYYALVFIYGVCWGSFLNVIAVRGLRNISLLSPSCCPSCKHALRWWELIPIVSWFILRGHCTKCQQPISFWYPVIEYITGVWMVSLVYTFPILFLPALFVLSSALIVTMRTDGEHFLILRWCTLGIIPCGLLGAYIGCLPISLLMSIGGCLLGWGYLTLIQKLFLWWKGYEGLGEGDIELLAAIGSFIGPVGVLYTLIGASCLGTAYGLMKLILSPQKHLKDPIPFGFFLALGTWVTLVMKWF